MSLVFRFAPRTEEHFKSTDKLLLQPHATAATISAV